MKSEVEGFIASKLKTSMQFATVSARVEGQSWLNSVFESEAVQEIGPVADAKQDRQWSKTMKNALEQIRPNSRAVFECVERPTEKKVNDAADKSLFIQDETQSPR